MTDFEIRVDKKACIGCGACIAADPDSWKIGKNGKCESKKGGNKLGFGHEDLQKHMETAEVCPVNAMHIKDLKEEKELV